MPVARPLRLALRATRRPAISPLALAVLAVLARPALAADVPLRVDPRLLMTMQLGGSAMAPSAAQPTTLEADVLEGRTDVEMRARGAVRLERGNTVLAADRLRVDQVTNDANAEGNVELRRGEDSIRGPRARMNLDTQLGNFEAPSYSLTPRGALAQPGVKGTGEADALRFEGANQYRLFNATYSTCPAPGPDWYLRAKEMELDFDRDRGEAHHTTLVFKDVPIAYMPWIDFPLSGGRQSGLLPPTFGSSTNTGVDLSLPYYFNLAPNYDATLAPRWMGRRGVQLNGEFRYLTASSTGRLAAEYLPRDAVTATTRDLTSVLHTQALGYGWSGFVNATRVSDRDYFADLSTRIASTSQPTLNQQLGVNYSNGEWLGAAMNVQRFQVITGGIPYSRLPQLTARASQPDWMGMNLQLPAELTKFHHPTADKAVRSVAYPQVSLPLQSPGAFLIPKFGVHLSYYNIDRQTSTGPNSKSRSVPIMSLDTGLNFERETRFGDSDYIQTLEPRIYYVRAAYRDQTDIPVFDSAPADFNFSQLYSENIFLGSDRIVDANQITVGVSSRFIEAENGVEWLRMGVGQRFHFGDQRVTLPGVAPREGSVADLLAGVSGRVYDKVWMDTLVQYDQREDRSERAAVSIRYQPDFAKVISASWRFKDGEFRDIDVAAQWPLFGNWYGVGRMNRNLRDDRLSEALAGFEYKGDCWVLRTVWQTLINTKQERNNSIFVQLELNGLASFGSSPVQLLRRSVSGYGKINESGTGDAVFGSR